MNPKPKRAGVYAKVWCCLLKHFAKRLPKVMAKYMHLFSLSSLRQSLEIPVLGLSRSNHRSSINKSITNVNTWDKVSRYFYIMNNSFKFFITFFFSFCQIVSRSTVEHRFLVACRNGFFLYRLLWSCFAHCKRIKTRQTGWSVTDEMKVKYRLKYVE